MQMNLSKFFFMDYIFDTMPKKSLANSRSQVVFLFSSKILMIFRPYI